MAKKSDASDSGDQQINEPLLPVVGIGASAGGLDALRQFFTGMSPATGLAFVVIQHLDPNHESMMADLLQKFTKMSVVPIRDGMEVKADTVFTIPPNRYVTLDGNRLRLQDPIEKRGMRLPIDFFFNSLARVQGERSVCVILSGTGSDGTQGLRAIKGEGGTAFVQEPESAQYDGMPSAAVATELVDVVLPVEQLPEALERYVEYSRLHDSGAADDGASPTKAEQGQARFNAILAFLAAQSGHDFRCYKKGTLSRRIQRRMGICQVNDYKAYLKLLRDDPSEANLLLKDLLIGVTAFFRDPDSWTALEHKVLSGMISGRASKTPIRIWIPGCSSGEEAYTMAILIAELQAKLGNASAVQIFASDIDEAALEIARTGVYPETIESDLDAEKLQRYFVKEAKGYRVAKRIRDMVVFASQNLISDPPFSKIDLISCRNLLIYLNPTIQKRVISLFHFTLVDGGFLFLGPSESISNEANLFKSIDKKWRIFSKISGASKTRSRLEFPILNLINESDNLQRTMDLGPRPGTIQAVAHEVLLSEYCPAAVILNRKSEALYFYGPISEYLRVAPGEPSRDIANMTRESLQIKVRSAVQRCLRSGDAVSTTGTIESDGKTRRIQILVRPVTRPKAAEGFLLLTFENVIEEAREGEAQTKPPQEDTVENPADEIRQLEFELAATREDLQSTIEELETSNEELRASNEEVMSMNEELQSTNEELETSKEELQSLNEELSTVNNELHEKVNDLEISNDDLRNLLDSTNIATLFLDRNYAIRRFTPAITQLFRLIPGDVGRPLGDITTHFNEDLLDRARLVLDKLQPVEFVLQVENEDYYNCNIIPYRTSEDRIDGLVLTFVNVTPRIKNEQALEAARTALEAERDILNAVMDRATPSHLVYLDRSFKVLNVNRIFCEHEGLEKEEIVGKNYFELFPNKAKQRLFEDARERLQHLEFFDDPAPKSSNDVFPVDYWDWNITPVVGRGGDCEGLVLARQNVTNRKLVQEELKLGNEVFKQSAEGILISDAEFSVVKVNPAFAELSGYRRDQAGESAHSLFRSSESLEPQPLNELVAGLEFKSGKWQGEMTCHTSSGKEFPVWMTVSCLMNSDHQIINYLFIFSDISSLKSSMERIQHLATHDDLTGLPNRAVFMDRLSVTIAQDNRHPQRFAVVFIDVDDFKKINDSLGHKVGDMVLKKVANGLRRVIREEDTLARFGGDEFVLLLKDADKDQLRSTLRRFQELMMQVDVGDHEISTASSIGVSMFPDDSRDPEKLIVSADNAMYSAKKAGKNRICFFSQEQQQEMARVLELDNDLKKAVKKSQFAVAYRPKLDFQTGKVAGAQAEFIWNHPRLGEVHADEFMRLVDTPQLASDLSEVLLEAICKDISQLPLKKRPEFHVVVDLWPALFKFVHVPNLMTKQLNRFKVNAKRLMVSLSKAVMRSEDHADAIHELHELGIRLSVRGCGFGASALRALQAFDVNELTIAEEFTRELETDQKMAQIVTAVGTMAKAMGLNVCVENSEGESAKKQLEDASCDFWLDYSKPRGSASDLSIQLAESGH